jgi:hypothetical protein
MVTTAPRYALRAAAQRPTFVPALVALTAALVLIGALTLISTDALAQGGCRAWGMAGAYTAACRGIDAVDWNPANLALPRPAALTFALGDAAFDLHNNAFSLSRYNEVSGATLTEADKRQLLADIPDDGFSLLAGARASAFGVSRGPFALTFSAVGGASGTLAKDFFDLVLMGNPIDRTFSFDGTGGEGYAAAGATFTAAAPVLTTFGARLCAGVNVRYLHGLYEGHVEQASGGLVTTLDGISGDARASVVSASGGNGWSTDLGLSLQAPMGWTFGLMVENLAGKIRWDERPERHLFSVTADSINATMDDIDAAMVHSDTTVAADPYTTHLPRKVRLGAANRFGPFLVAADVAQGLEERGGVTKKTQLSVGTEWLLASWLRPRAGIALGGGVGTSGAAGLGLGLGPWKFDVAAFNRGRLLPGDTKGLGLAVGTRFEF